MNSSVREWQSLDYARGTERHLFLYVCSRILRWKFNERGYEWSRCRVKKVKASDAQHRRRRRMGNKILPHYSSSMEESLSFIFSMQILVGVFEIFSFRCAIKFHCYPLNKDEKSWRTMVFSILLIVSEIINSKLQ